MAQWCGGVVGGVWNKCLQPSRVGEGLGPLKINMGEWGTKRYLGLCVVAWSCLVDTPGVVVVVVWREIVIGVCVLEKDCGCGGDVIS